MDKQSNRDCCYHEFIESSPFWSSFNPDGLLQLKSHFQEFWLKLHHHDTQPKHRATIELKERVINLKSSHFHVTAVWWMFCRVPLWLLLVCLLSSQSHWLRLRSLAWEADQSASALTCTNAIRHVRVFRRLWQPLRCHMAIFKHWKARTSSWNSFHLDGDY